MKNVYKAINSSVFSHIYLTDSPMLSFFSAFSEAYSEEAFDIFMGFSVASITTNEWNGSPSTFKRDDTKWLW